MNLRQWTSNSNLLNDQARTDGVNAALTIKVLGLVWNAETDTLSLSLAKLCEEISNTERFTKRSVLSLSSKLFDPLGFVEPVTAKEKRNCGKLTLHGMTIFRQITRKTGLNGYMNLNT